MPSARIPSGPLQSSLWEDSWARFCCPYSCYQLSMFGWLGTATCCLNRRRTLRLNRKILHTSKIWIILMACVVFVCSGRTNPAFAQATSGPVRITLDEAIQMALQHNHNIIAARTAIEQSQDMEVTANLRPNPTLFTDWEY